MKKNLVFFGFIAILLLNGCVSPSKLFPFGIVDKEGSRTAYFEVDGAPVFNHIEIFETIRLSLADTATHGYPVVQLWERGGVEFTTVLGKKITVLREVAIKDSVANKTYDFYEFTTDYYPGKLYVDKRFVSYSKIEDADQRDTLKFYEVLSRLQAVVGQPYCWGGNSQTAFSFADYYENLNGLLYGYDCSGLYDWAMNTKVRHNSKDWIKMGEVIKLEENPNLKDLLDAMKVPEDQALFMVVHQSHVIGFIKNYDEIYSIESTWNQSVGQGVTQTLALQRLYHLLEVEDRKYTSDANQVSKINFVLVRII